MSSFLSSSVLKKFLTSRLIHHWITKWAVKVVHVYLFLKVINEFKYSSLFYFHCKNNFLYDLVLSKVSEFVRGKSLPSFFTFNKDLVRKWLTDAKQDCCLASFKAEEIYYGGPSFSGFNTKIYIEQRYWYDVVWVTNFNFSCWQFFFKYCNYYVFMYVYVSYASIYMNICVYVYMYVEGDSSTHWTEPSQLFTWWKNNIERKNKFKLIQTDAEYSGSELRKSAR